MKTILIVDDEPAARYGLRRALEGHYRIVEADSAAAGALITVVGEAGSSATGCGDAGGRWAVVSEMAARGRKRAAGADGICPGHGETAVEALQLGAADYLVKGFELEELRQRVANLLKLATLEKENDVASTAAGDGRTVWTDDWPVCRNAAGV